MSGLSQQRGLTLVELLISMLLGLVLVGGMLELMQHSRTTDDLQQSYARMQENARFALDTLSYEIRMAGSGGCAPSVPTQYTSITWPIEHDSHIKGFDNRQYRLWRSYFSRSNKHSDALIIRRLDEENGLLIGEQTPQSNRLPLQAPHTLKKGTLLALSDRNCTEQLEVSVAKTPTSKRGAQELLLTTPLENSSRFANGRGLPQLTVAYYIRPGSDGVTPGLYQKPINGYAEELISGIENLQFLFAVDSNKDQQVDRLLRADQVSDWQSVHSVQIHLLARSLKPHADSSSAYYFLGEKHTTNDHYLREAFSQTVQLRN